MGITRSYESIERLEKFRPAFNFNLKYVNGTNSFEFFNSIAAFDDRFRKPICFLFSVLGIMGMRIYSCIFSSFSFFCGKNQSSHVHAVFVLFVS